MQLSMQTFCSVAVALVATGGAMALQAPLQLFAGTAVVILATAVYIMWSLLHEVKGMAWSCWVVETNSTKILERVPTCRSQSA